MRAIRCFRHLVLAAMLPAALPAAAVAAEPLHLECAGPFGRESSEAALIAVFGAEHVLARMIDGPEGMMLDATLVYPDDPLRRLAFLWHDEAGRSHPIAILIEGESEWIGPGGIRLGTTLAEVEAANGGPFTILGFGWDYGGAASFPAGVLATIPGACRLSLTFDTDQPLGPEYDAIMGDGEFSSDHPLMAKLAPAVVQIAVGYPAE